MPLVRSHRNCDYLVQIPVPGTCTATMERFVENALLPVFATVHAILWHSCKYHEDDGMCVRLFGLTWDGNHHCHYHHQNGPRSSWNKFWVDERQELSQQILERQQHYRLEFVRELNLALALLCVMAKFTQSQSSRTHVMVVECMVFGVAAWDAAQMKSLVLPMIVVWKLALLGLLLQLSRDNQNVQKLLQSLDHARGVTTAKPRVLVLPVLVPTKKESDPKIIPVVMSRKKSDENPPVLEPRVLFNPSDLKTLPDESTVTATIIKPDKLSVVGITLRKVPNSWRIVISELSPDGLFAKSSLRVGQTLIAVNGIPASSFSTAKDVTTIIKEATRHVSIAATRSICIPVLKPTRESRLGFSFIKRDTNLFIHKIHPDGLVQSTQLREGMRVLGINEQPAPTSMKDAVALVKETEGTLVMIVSPIKEPKKDTMESVPPLPKHSRVGKGEF